MPRQSPAPPLDLGERSHGSRPERIGQPGLSYTAPPPFTRGRLAHSCPRSTFPLLGGPALLTR